jgi:hypothetical protein
LLFLFVCYTNKLVKVPKLQAADLPILYPRSIRVVCLRQLSANLQTMHPPCGSG